MPPPQVSYPRPKTFALSRLVFAVSRPQVPHPTPTFAFTLYLAIRYLAPPNVLRLAGRPGVYETEYPVGPPMQPATAAIKAGLLPPAPLNITQPSQRRASVISHAFKNRT